MKRLFLFFSIIVMIFSISTGESFAKDKKYIDVIKTSESGRISASKSLSLSGKVTKQTSAVMYTKSDLKYLACIIYAEAENQIYDGKVAVGQVVLNRVRSKKFPNSIKAVIYDRKHKVQFTPAYNGSLAAKLKLYKKKDDVMMECISAAIAAFHGKNVIGNKLYFHKEGKITNGMDFDYTESEQVIGAHIFY